MSNDRKKIPISTGVLKYFPNAIHEVAKVSYMGSKQHHPDKGVFWDKNKSNDHDDAMMRHLIDHLSGNEIDTDGVLHLSKVAWRALALLEMHLVSSDD